MDVLVWTLLTVVLMWMPTGTGSPAIVGSADRLIHFGLFMVLGALVCSRARRNPGSRAPGIYWGVLVLTALAAEGGQSVIPTRTFESMDLVTNLAGALHGVFLQVARPDEGWPLQISLVGCATIGIGGGGILFDEWLFVQSTLATSSSPGLSHVVLCAAPLPLAVLLVARSDNLRGLIYSGLCGLFVFTSSPSGSLLATATGSLLHVLLGTLMLLRPGRPGTIGRLGLVPLLTLWYSSWILPPSLWLAQFGDLLVAVQLLIPSGVLISRHLRTGFDPRVADAGSGASRSRRSRR